MQLCGLFYFVNAIFLVTRAQESDKTIYLPTLYPGDSVFQIRWAYPEAAAAHSA